MTEVADNTLVDGRYRIVRRIGSGGMADVYCAEDTHLGREVALKVLHRRFAQDQEFVERFRREAKAAAGLGHPHVVGVFDRGEHQGTYYIAMEHLQGRTLKEIVSTEAPLDQLRVIDFGVQILEAAGFAHQHGVIHRDFKPHNVIVDAEGLAKVTDFGIARAGASEMTETGSIMGTAQYLSPEQAQGHAVTATSDLYSIGVMLYEMLAGRLPFDGDSAVSVALKHLSEPPPPISSFRPDVHPALEAVVMASLAKDPARRWQTAEDFEEALTAARTQIETGDDGQGTSAFVPIPVPAPLPGAEAADGNGAAPLAAVDEPQEERRRRWPWFTIGLLALALAGFLAYLGISALLEPETRSVPRAVGKQYISARAVLERAGFDVRQTRVRSAQPFDQVVEQDPNPGEQAEEGSVVTLEVSNGPGEVRVPSVAKLPQEQAVREIQKARLKVTIEREFSDEVDEDFAIRTVPRAATEVTRGTRITLFVSDGPEQVTVPEVIGLSQGSAESRLAGEGLGVAVVEQESEETEGSVIAQDPGGGSQVDRGATVTITVSLGIERVGVPNVVGQSAGDAQAQISAAGLTTARSERTVSDEAQDGVVIAQRPGAGAEVEEGSQVVIIVGVFEDPAEEELAPAPDPGPGPGPGGRGAAAVRVAVLAGGRSSEHDVSLASAEAVRAGLVAGGHEPVDVRLSRDGGWSRDGESLALEPGRGLLGCEVAFPVLHGPFGEDGTVQGLLEILDLPYVGAGVTASALAMDKALFKDLMAAHGVPQVDYAVVRQGERPSIAAPVFVKPARLGSSVGIAKAWSEADVAGALEGAFRHDPVALVERFCEGIEVECSVLGHSEPVASQPGEIVIRGADWYDYEAKYSAGGMELLVPPRVPEAVREEVRAPGGGGVPAGGLLGDGPRRLLRGGRRRAGQRAEHDPGVYFHERVREALRGQRSAVRRAAGPIAEPGARAP